MRAVVADTGPLNYLVLVGRIDILRALFGRVLVPQAVLRELSHPSAPASVRAWTEALPDWISPHTDSGTADDALQRLGAGEREAILLADAVRADLMLMDDRVAVTIARARGLAVVGTLGLIDRAASRGLLDLDQTVSRLKATNFRCRPALLDHLLERHRKA